MPQKSGDPPRNEEGLSASEGTPLFHQNFPPLFFLIEVTPVAGERLLTAGAGREPTMSRRNRKSQ